MLALLAALLVAAAPPEGKEPARAPAKKTKATKKPAGGKAKPVPKKAPGGRAVIADLQPAAGAALPMRPVASRPLDEQGSVRGVVRGKAYLDAGTRDGLSVGDVIGLLRRGEPATSCKVEAATERNAICTGSGLRPGDTFAVNPKAAGSLPAELPPKPDAEEQARRLRVVQKASLAMVDFKTTRTTDIELPERLRRLEVGFTHYSWLSSDASAIHQEQVRAVAYDVPVWRGSRLNLDVTGVYRTPDPQDSRFEPGQKSQVWVREASLSWSDAASPWRVAAGRVLPWLSPGGPTFDGVQAGWRPRQGAELGIFGGGVPDPSTTAPGFERATAGGYWSAEAILGPALVRSDGRLAYMKYPDSKTRIEADLVGQAWISRRLDLAGQLRLAGGDYAAPKHVDAFHLDATWVQPAWITAWAGYRYDESRVPDVAAPSVYPGRTRQVAGGVSWDRMGWLLIRAVGGHSQDVATGLDRTWVGPELAAPRLFGKWGGMMLGYAEELGTWPGRSAWLQGDLALSLRARLLARASWYMDERPVPLSADHDLGLTLACLADLAPWLRFRLQAMSRYAIPLNEGAPSTWGASILAGLEGRY